MGKAGALARERYTARHLGEFAGLSYLAEQIIVDKPDHWEYKLTLELLRLRTGPVLKRWGFLKKGLYSKPTEIIRLSELSVWMQARHAETKTILSAFGGLLNAEFQAAWGEPGIAGSDTEIAAVCSLFADACAEALQWEETVRFARLPSAFEPVRALMMGMAGVILDEVVKLPAQLHNLFAQQSPSGAHRISLKFELPDDWSDQYEAAMGKALAELLD